MGAYVEVVLGVMRPESASGYPRNADTSYPANLNPINQVRVLVNAELTAILKTHGEAQSGIYPTTS
jgi:hypothetical protein